MSERVTVAGGSLDEDFRQILRHVGHEIRNPLFCLQAGIQLVQRLTHPEGEVAEQLASLLNQVARIERVTQGLHQLARLDVGTPRWLSLAECTPWVVQELRPVAAQAGVSLAVTRGPACEIEADPANLSTVLREIVSNAVKASPAGGTVTVGWEVSASGTLTLHVDDEGLGVADEYATEIFRPFFSTQPGGRGLGLTLALRACRLMGAELAWENLSCGGCRFSILMPRARIG